MAQENIRTSSDKQQESFLAKYWKWFANGAALLTCAVSFYEHPIAIFFFIVGFAGLIFLNYKIALRWTKTEVAVKTKKA